MEQSFCFILLLFFCISKVVDCKSCVPYHTIPRYITTILLSNAILIKKQINFKDTENIALQTSFIRRFFFIFYFFFQLYFRSYWIIQLWKLGPSRVASFQENMQNKSYSCILSYIFSERLACGLQISLFFKIAFYTIQRFTLFLYFHNNILFVLC